VFEPRTTPEPIVDTEAIDVRRTGPAVTASLLALVMWALVPLVAWAATSTVAPSAATPEAKVGVLYVQWWIEAEAGQVVAIISTDLDPSTKLPVTVRLPIPPGMSVDWAGEISGGAVDTDVERQYTVQPGNGGTYAQFVLSTYRTAQTDLSGESLDTEGGRVSGSFDFVQSAPSSSTALSVRLPPGVSDVAIVPAPEGAATSNAQGEMLYSLPPRTLRLGERAAVKVSYSTEPSGAVSSPGVDGSTNRLIGVLSLGILATLIVLFVVITRQRSRTNESPTVDAAVREQTRPERPAVSDEGAKDDDEPFRSED
jgi:hypothetical protein